MDGPELVKESGGGGVAAFIQVSKAAIHLLGKGKVQTPEPLCHMQPRQDTLTNKVSVSPPPLFGAT